MRFGRIRGLIATSSAVALTVVGATAAQAWYSSHGSGYGEGRVNADIRTVRILGPLPGGQVQIPLDFAPFALHGTIQNDSNRPVRIGKIRVTITDISRPGGGRVPRSQCDIYPVDTRYDFALTDAIGPFTAPAADSEGPGVGTWAGGSVQLVNAAHDQAGCLNAILTLHFDGVS
jgi:hypothetical protein